MPNISANMQKTMHADWTLYKSKSVASKALPVKPVAASSSPSEDSDVERHDGEFCQRVIRVSCTKMVRARTERGGAKLYKNLLILHMLRNARDLQFESLRQSLIISDPTPEVTKDSQTSSDSVDEDEENRPPFEFVVQEYEDDDLENDSEVPLVFATEGVEDWSGVDDEERLTPAPPLSDSLNALRPSSPQGHERKRVAPVVDDHPGKKLCAV